MRPPSYGWLGAGAQGQPIWSECIRLKKQNQKLLALVGEITLRLRGAKKGLMAEQKAVSKVALAKLLGVSRSSLYYVSKLDEKDWQTRTRISRRYCAKSRGTGRGDCATLSTSAGSKSAG